MELAGQVLTRPWKHVSPATHCSHRVASVNLYPGLHVQSPLELEPTGEVKFAAHAMISSALPPGQ
jgi:hypothetical protein